MNPLIKCLAVVLSVATALEPTVFGAAGELDAGFNPGSGANGLVLATAVQSDGKVIIAGSFTTLNGTAQNRVARLNTNGTLDSSFAIGSGPNDQVNAIAIQPDGKVLIGGFFTSVSTVTTRRVARLNTNGSVDSTFNPAPAFDQTNGADNTVTSIALQPDGKVLIGGTFQTYRGVQRIRVARLLADGTLDTSFNPGAGPDNSVSDILVEESGTVLIAGSFENVAGQSRGGIARLTANGTVDPTFVGSGIASGAIFDLAPAGNGKIVAAGTFVFYNTKSAKNLVRINSDGSHDPSFTSPLGNADNVSAVAVQATGKIIIGGEFATPSSPGVSPQANLARLNENGTVDSSFKPGSGPNNDVEALSLTPDGKIVIGGAFATYNGVSRNRVARVLGVNPPALRNIATRAGVQTDDRVAIAGFIVAGSGPKEVLLRGIGPSLAAQGVPGALQDPLIQLYNSAGVLVNGNNNWKDTQANAIGETGIPPADDREAALLINLGAGSYTVVLQGVGKTTGNGLIEVYDLTGGTNARLANISTRAFVGTGDAVMIGGLIVDGENARIVVRAIGPSLASAGVPDALSDPRVALYTGNGDLVGFNLDWQDGQSAEIAASGLQPSDDREAALIVTLQAGNYTAVVEGESSAAGVGLVEVYHVQ